MTLTSVDTQGGDTGDIGLFDLWHSTNNVLFKKATPVDKVNVWIQLVKRLLDELAKYENQLTQNQGFSNKNRKLYIDHYTSPFF